MLRMSDLCRSKRPIQVRKYLEMDLHTSLLFKFVIVLVWKLTFNFEHSIYQNEMRWLCSPILSSLFRFQKHLMELCCEIIWISVILAFVIYSLAGLVSLWHIPHFRSQFYIHSFLDMERREDSVICNQSCHGFFPIDFFSHLCWLLLGFGFWVKGQTVAFSFLHLRHCVSLLTAWTIWKFVQPRHVV